MESRVLFTLLLFAMILVGCEQELTAPTPTDEAELQSVEAAAHDLECDIDVPGDYNSIQGAVDNASSGDVICVDAGTYEEVISIDEDVTVVGLQAPDGPNAAVVDGRISLDADGAAVQRFKVAPSVVYTANNEPKSPSGIDPFGIRITASNATVEGNLLEGLEADASDGFVTINGIQAFGNTALTGITIKDNTVRNMHNDGGPSWPYGGAAAIKLQTDLDGVEVTGSTVEDVRSAGWAWGIVLATSGSASGHPKDVLVEKNTITGVNDGSVYDVFENEAGAPYPGSAFGIDGDAKADGATVQFNSFTGTPNGAESKDDGSILDAECNYWGHAEGPVESFDDWPGNSPNMRSRAFENPGEIDYEPWLVRDLTTGMNLENACVGGEDE